MWAYGLRKCRAAAAAAKLKDKYIRVIIKSPPQKKKNTEKSYVNPHLATIRPTERVKSLQAAAN